MANRDALLEIIPVLYELERQNRFYMSSWASGIANPNAHTITECGTQFCMAGAKAAYDGWLPILEERTREDGTKLWIASGGFVPADQQAERFSSMSPFARDAESIAITAFDLDSSQAQFLFFGTHISRVSDLEQRIRWIADGNNLNEYPEEFYELEHAHARQDEDRLELLGGRVDGEGY